MNPIDRPDVPFEVKSLAYLAYLASYWFIWIPAYLLFQCWLHNKFTFKRRDKRARALPLARREALAKRRLKEEAQRRINPTR